MDYCWCGGMVTQRGSIPSSTCEAFVNAMLVGKNPVLIFESLYFPVPLLLMLPHQCID